MARAGQGQDGANEKKPIHSQVPLKSDFVCYPLGALPLQALLSADESWASSQFGVWIVGGSVKDRGPKRNGKESVRRE